MIATRARCLEEAVVMTVSMHKILAALRLPAPVPALIATAEAILAAMTDNPSFPDPAPPLGVVASAVAALHDAEVATRSRTRGTVAVRNEKRAVVVRLLVRLKGYVQGVADENPEHAATLIESAGMWATRSAPPAKRLFSAKPGAVSGSVRLAVRSAGDRACYHWAWSADGGATWRPAPPTLQARTVLTGLPPVSNCLFRYRTVTKKGEGDWSEPLAMVVR